MRTRKVLAGEVTLQLRRRASPGGRLCCWCHRVMLLRKWHGLEQVLPASFVRPFMGDQGWTFEPGADALFGVAHMHEIYTRAKSDFTGW